MTIIQEDLNLPDGTDPHVVVMIDLWGAGQTISGFHPNTGTTVAGVSQITTDSDGVWQADVLPNDEILPTGTVYRIRRAIGCDMLTSFVSVPASGGPYEVFEIEEDPMANIAPSALASMAYALSEYQHAEGSVLGQQALSRIRAQLARSRQLGASAQIILLGDSLTEGYNATARNKRWSDHLSNSLNGRGGVSAGKSQYFPAAAGGFTQSILPADWPGGQMPWVWSDAADTVALATHGPDLHARRINTGDYAELTFNGDLCTVVYTATTTGPAAAAVTFDGVGVTAIDALNNPELPGQLVTYGTIGDYGRHTIRITATGAPLIIEGIITYDGGRWGFGTHFDTVEVFCMGHAGFATIDFVNNNNWARSLGSIGRNAGVIVVALGANDLATTDPILDPPTSPGDYAKNMVTILQKIDAAVAALGVTDKPCYLLVQMATLTEAYNRAAWDVAAAIGLDRVAVLDLQKRLPNKGVDWGMFASSGHPNDQGQLWIADAVASFIDERRQLPLDEVSSVRVHALDVPQSRLAWAQSFVFPAAANTAQTLVTDNSPAAAAVGERRHRRWFSEGTWTCWVEFERNTSRGTIEVLVNGVSCGTSSTAGTANSLAVQLGTPVVIDSPGFYPVVIRKTSAAGLVAFHEAILQKTA